MTDTGSDTNTYEDLDPEVVQWVEMLGSEDLNDRLVAAKALQHMGDEDTNNSLVGVLNEDSPANQKIAITAL